MTANHRTDLLDLIAKLDKRISDLEASRALGSLQVLDSKVLTATTPSITLSVPPGSAFSTLRVAWTARSDNASAATYMCMQLNGDTANHYIWQINQANNATMGPGNSGGATNLIQVGTIAAASSTSGYVGGGEFSIPNASGTTFKAPNGYSTSMQSTTTGYSGSYGGLWLVSTAVISITLFPLAGNFIAGSAAYLYGVT